MNYSIKDSEYFNYKTSTTSKSEGNNAEKENIKIDVPSKYLSNFLRSLDIQLINCEISLDLKWSKTCVLTSKAYTEADPAGINNTTNVVFYVADSKLYVPVGTLSAENENELFEQLKEGFKITVTWNKYRSQISNQTANNNLNYLIDPTFNKFNRLFVLTFRNEEDKSSFSKYYTTTVEIEDFNVMIDQKPFFEIPIKNKEETYEPIIEMCRNNDYITSNLLDYEYFSTHCKLIAKDLSKQFELENKDLKQQLKFIGRLEQNATLFFIIEKEEEEKVLNFS